jgi:type I restriction-modification system DNA methylase subunit
MNFGTRGCMYCEGECNKECLSQEEPKQETVEAAAEKYAEENAKDGNISYHNLYAPLEYAFRNGAEWQAEQQNLRLKHTEALLANCEKALDKAIKKSKQRYSEEEVMDMFHSFSMHLPLHYEFLVKEQFKKK